MWYTPQPCDERPHPYCDPNPQTDQMADTEQCEGEEQVEAADPAAHAHPEVGHQVARKGASGYDECKSRGHDGPPQKCPKSRAGILHCLRVSMRTATDL